MKNLLIVIPSLKVGGGAERVAALLTTQIHSYYNIKILTFYDTKDKYPVNGEYHTLGESLEENILFKTKKLFSRAGKISRFCKKNKIDTVLSFMEDANFSVILSRTMFRNKCKLLCSIRTNPQRYSNNKIYSYLIKTLYPRADMIIANTKGVQDILSEEYHLRNVKVIYNMYNLSENIKLSKEKISSNVSKLFNNGFIFINVGRLSEPKGQWYLIRAFSAVVKIFPSSKLLIIGEGELYAKLYSLVKSMKLEKNIFILPNQKNIFPVLNSSNCFVFTSLYEGMPNVIIEALSVNLPIISTDCKTGPREILCPEYSRRKRISYPYYGSRGILVKNFDRTFVFKNVMNQRLCFEENMLSEAMIKIVTDTSLRKKYSKGLIRAKDFSASKIVSQWKKVL